MHPVNKLHLIVVAKKFQICLSTLTTETLCTAFADVTGRLNIYPHHTHTTLTHAYTHTHARKKKAKSETHKLTIPQIRSKFGS